MCSPRTTRCSSSGKVTRSLGMFATFSCLSWPPCRFGETYGPPLRKVTASRSQHQPGLSHPLDTAFFSTCSFSQVRRCSLLSASTSYEAHGRTVDTFLSPVMRPDVGIISVFPPMAWLPFGIFGLLYGRLLLAKKWGRSALFGINAVS